MRECCEESAWGPAPALRASVSSGSGASLTTMDYPELLHIRFTRKEQASLPAKVLKGSLGLPRNYQDFIRILANHKLSVATCRISLFRV